jgi:hypothetical protein
MCASTAHRQSFRSSTCKTAEGTITSPPSGAWINDNPTVSLDIDGNEGAVERVEFVGHYDDYPWKGAGVYRQWHFRYWYDQFKDNIGTDDAAPYEVEWDTKWIPEQEEPMKISARIVDKNGMIFMAPAVEDVKFARKRIVHVYKASNVPKAMNASGGCDIDIDNDPSDALGAIIRLNTWAGNGADRKVAVNGTAIQGDFGFFHDRALVTKDVPVSALKQGTNAFTFQGKLSGQHAFEINWPGPVIFAEYENPNPVSTKPVSLAHHARARVSLKNGRLVVNNPAGGAYTLRATALDGRTVLAVEGSGVRCVHAVPRGRMAGGACVLQVSTGGHVEAKVVVVRE